MLDLRGCAFRGLVLKDAVLSGGILDNSDWTGSRLPHVEMARVSARSSHFENVDFTDGNLYGAQLDGADLRHADFTNAIMSNASFGKDPATGAWADLSGANFEGALLSRTDAKSLCVNPTVDDEGRAILGCR